MNINTRGNLGNFNSKLKSFFATASDVAQLISALLSLMVLLGTGSAIVGFFKNNFSVLLVGVAVLILSLTTLAALKIFVVDALLISQKSQDESVDSYPPPEASGEVTIVLKEIVYVYTDKNNIYQRKRFKLKAVKDGVFTFSDRYCWTGRGSCEIQSLTPGFTIVNQRKQEFWDYFDVQFPHPLRVGAECDFTIQWKLIDIDGIASSFLSTMIDTPTDRLSMEVNLPPELAPQNARLHEFRNYIDKLPIKTEAAQWDAATQSIRYDVVKPSLNHKYIIHWYWT